MVDLAQLVGGSQTQSASTTLSFQLINEKENTMGSTEELGPLLAILLQLFGGSSEPAE